MNFKTFREDRAERKGDNRIKAQGGGIAENIAFNPSPATSYDLCIGRTPEGMTVLGFVQAIVKEAQDQLPHYSASISIEHDIGGTALLNAASTGVGIYRLDSLPPPPGDVYVALEVVPREIKNSSPSLRAHLDSVDVAAY